jgi:hypothetical protein|tara:strand:- start:258 stop:497 length:240 start_codon:yes stop_codon:yes gene_type:complete
MVKYKYKNETVLKEFVGRFIRALAKRKGKQVARVLSADPEIKKMVKKSTDLEKDMKAYLKKKRKEDPAYQTSLDAIRGI